MNYELARGLKDAGFPQKEYGSYGDGERYQFRETDDPFVPNNRTMWVRYYNDDFIQEHLSEIVYFPTLSELIEACEEEFYSVNQNATNDGKGWSAESWGSADVETGNSPSEAVARLWLALNRK